MEEGARQATGDITLKTVGTRNETGFEVNKEAAISVIKAICPDKLRETTKSFTLTQSGNVTMMEARNKDGIVEYAVPLLKEPAALPSAPDYSERMAALKREGEEYKKIARTGYLIMGMVVACMIGALIALIYFKGAV